MSLCLISDIRCLCFYRYTHTHFHLTISLFKEDAIGGPLRCTSVIHDHHNQPWIRLSHTNKTYLSMYCFTINVKVNHQDKMYCPALCCLLLPPDSASCTCPSMDIRHTISSLVQSASSQQQQSASPASSSPITQPCTVPWPAPYPMSCTNKPILPKTSSTFLEYALDECVLFGCLLQKIC